jgi:hypothetical protein
MKTMKAEKARKAAKKTPSEIIGASNVLALKKAGFVIVAVSELSQFRENIKSLLDILSEPALGKSEKNYDHEYDPHFNLGRLELVSGS